VREATKALNKKQKGDGTIPNKALKIAQKRVADNQQFLLECWNKCTDGLYVDINHFLGTVPLKIAALK